MFFQMVASYNVFGGVYIFFIINLKNSNKTDHHRVRGNERKETKYIHCMFLT